MAVTKRRATGDGGPTTYAGGGGGMEGVLADAGLGGIEGLLPRAALARLAMALAQQPAVTARHLQGLSSEMLAIVMGAGDLDELDYRFADRTWRENPLFRRLAHSYYAQCRTLQGILDDVDLDSRTKRMLQMPLDNALAALAPTNNPLTNPAWWKETLETGGSSIRTGLANLARDLRTATRLPSGVDRDPFVFGETIAATPGKVVRRERTYELLEYEPRTESVDVVPTLIVTSPVNKFYLVDLDPESSVLKEHLDRGRRVFVPSWVNPDATHADVGFDGYVASIVEAIETAAEICGTDRVHVLGLCGGGQLVLLTAGYLAAVGRQDLLATLSIGIAIADFHGDEDGPLIDERSGETAIRRATKRGCFPATEQAMSFALMRPDESIWGNVVRHYLLGKPTPAVALIAWAVDQTNLSTGFGADLIRLSLSNGLTRPGGIEILGQPIDTRKITTPTFVLGASEDHISPWKDCYRTVGMLGGEVTFTLAKGGHAIVIARPMSHPRGAHWTGDPSIVDPDDWFAAAQQQRGSWWENWSSWVENHEPEKRSAPTRQGSAAHPPTADAPGQYVRRVIV